MKQLQLFESTKSNTNNITRQDIAAELHVSDATIRNWINAGVLKKTSHKDICHDSYTNFKNQLLGKSKLNKRAHKLFILPAANDHIISGLQKKIATVYQGGKSIADTLSSDYESSLGESYRNREGIFYTEQSIIAAMLATLTGINEDSSFCDPCCGTGNFLLHAINCGVKPQNLYGFDTDPIALEIARARIFAKTGYRTNNLQQADFLSHLWTLNEAEIPHYDFVFTNPPWGKKIPPALKKQYADNLNNGIRIDTSALFTLAILRITKEGGTLGLLLPEAFFNIATYQSVRGKLLQQEIVKIIDHDRPFAKLQTRAQSIVVKKSKPPTHHQIKCGLGENIWSRCQDDFLHTPNFIYNFYCSAAEAAVIDHIYQKPHITLKNNAVWGLGIVTGDNNRFLYTRPNKNSIPVYRGSEIEKNNFKNPELFLDHDFSNLQQVAPIELYTASEKIIYRFISNNLVFAYDNQQRFMLNSANFLVLRENFAIEARSVSTFFNCKIINWIFQKIFRTHKILRGDLECLPIFAEFIKAEPRWQEADLWQYLGIEESNGTFRVKK